MSTAWGWDNNSAKALGTQAMGVSALLSPACPWLLPGSKITLLEPIVASALEEERRGGQGVTGSSRLVF